MTRILTGKDLEQSAAVLVELLAEGEAITIRRHDGALEVTTPTESSNGTPYKNTAMIEWLLDAQRNVPKFDPPVTNEEIVAMVREDRDR